MEPTPRRARLASGVTALALAAVMVVGAPGTAHAGPADDLVALINTERAAAGLGPLTLNGDMNGVAAAWSQQMADAGALSHNPSYATLLPDGWSAAAENTGQVSPADVAGLHRAWMASPGHRANVLGAAYTDVGIAVVVQNGTAWGTEVFAAYGSPPPPSRGAAPAPRPAPPLLPPTPERPPATLDTVAELPPPAAPPPVEPVPASPPVSPGPTPAQPTPAAVWTAAAEVTTQASGARDVGAAQDVGAETRRTVVGPGPVEAMGPLLIALAALVGVLLLGRSLSSRRRRKKPPQT